MSQLVTETSAAAPQDDVSAIVASMETDSHVNVRAHTIASVVSNSTESTSSLFLVDESLGEVRGQQSEAGLKFDVVYTQQLDSPKDTVGLQKSAAAAARLVFGGANVCLLTFEGDASLIQNELYGAGDEHGSSGFLHIFAQQLFDLVDDEDRLTASPSMSSPTTTKGSPASKKKAPTSNTPASKPNPLRTQVNRTVTVSFVEAITETFDDLLTIPRVSNALPVEKTESYATLLSELAPRSTKLKLRSVQDEGKIPVEGALELQCASLNDFLKAVQPGVSRRCCHKLQTNSIAAVFLRVTLKQTAVGAAQRVSTFMVCDLGSTKRLPPNMKQGDATKISQARSAIRKLLTGLGEIQGEGKEALSISTSQHLGKSGPTVRLNFKDHLCLSAAVRESPITKMVVDFIVGSADRKAPSANAKSKVKPSGAVIIALTSIRNPSIISEPTTDGSVAELRKLSQLNRISTSVRLVEIQATTLQNQASEIKDEITELRRLLAETNNNAERDETEVLEMECRLAMKSNELESLSEALSGKKEAHAHLVARCQEQQRAVEKAQAELAKRKAVNAEAEELARAIEKERQREAEAKLEIEMGEKQAEVASRNTRARSKSVAVLREGRNNQLRAIRDSHMHLKDADQKRWSGFFRQFLLHQKSQGQVRLVELQNAELGQQRELLECALANVIQEVEACKSEITELTTIHEQLIQQEETLKDDSEKEVATADQFTQRVEEEISLLREDIATVETTLANTNKTYQFACDTRQLHLDENILAHETLRSNIMDLKDEIRHFDATTVQLEERLAKLKSTHTTLQSQLSAEARDYETALRNEDILCRKVAGASQFVDEAAADLEHTVAQLRHVEKQITVAQKSITAKESEKIAEQNAIDDGGAFVASRRSVTPNKGSSRSPSVDAVKDYRPPSWFCAPPTKRSERFSQRKVANVARE